MFCDALGSNNFAYQMEQNSKQRSKTENTGVVRIGKEERELEKSYESMKHYFDEALKEVSVWKKRRS